VVTFYSTPTAGNLKDTATVVAIVDD